MQIKTILPLNCVLAEGPVWDEREQVLWWVNILAGELHRYDPTSGQNRTFEIGRHVGAQTSIRSTSPRPKKALLRRKNKPNRLLAASLPLKPHIRAERLIVLGGKRRAGMPVRLCATGMPARSTRGRLGVYGPDE